MIITLTPNPSIDRTVVLDALRVGGVNRAESVRQDPGGKGVNVSRAAVQHDAETLSVLPLGGPEGDVLARLLEAAGVPVRASSIGGTTRLNTTLATADGVTTKINEPGPVLDSGDAAGLVRACVDAAAPGDWILGAGSLPPGAPADLYAQLVRAGHATGAHVAIDSSGAALREALAAGPDLIKPNHHELGEVVRREVVTLGDVVAAARELNHEGVQTVVVSLGGSGALAVTSETVLHARAPRVRPRSTVGAGDALLAGHLVAATRGEDLAASLRLGVRFGTAAARLDGSLMPTPHDIADVTVTLCHHPDLDETVDE